MVRKVIQIHYLDQVGVVTVNMEENEEFIIPSQGETRKITVLSDIPEGHKVAIELIKNGQKVMKYGQVIGIATQDILPGQHVHLHNLKSGRGGVLNE